MLHSRYILLKLNVVALLVLLVSTANAEWKNRLQSQGNNIGMTVSLTSGGPLDCAYYELPPTQFPRGSGNLYVVGRWGWGANVARDCNGDGSFEDTTANLSRGGSFGNPRNSLEVADQLAAFAAAGERMNDAAGRISFNRVWTSTDAEDLADWPAEFRTGRTADGAPILHGAETIVCILGDAFNEYSPALGLSMEHQFYFLNFAESNNMVYYHILFRNMSEYNKWNPNPDLVTKVSGTPNGQVWGGMQMTYSTANGFYIGGNDEGWAYYFPRGICANIDRNGIESSFTGHPANVANMLFANPQWNGQEMTLTNTCRHQWTCEFGFCGTEEVLEGGYPMNRAYRFGLGKNAPAGPFYPTETNPWTGGRLYGWPGILEDGDTRFEKWIWGSSAGGNNYNFYSEFNDFSPRDSFSIDGVIMFVYPANPPWAMPQSVISEIDNAELQSQLQPFLDYADVAEIVRGGNYILPETPNPPALTIIPGDKEVTITWSDVNVNTPDAYYQFLQDNPSLDPNGVYREFDFEGFRLYRSFVGPSDSHSQLIYESSLSASNLSFFFKDTQAGDQPLYRMNNGMRVWYALVPYDRNFDPSTGDEFSLPLPTSGKVWNRPGSQGTFNVQPRSEASNFRSPSLAAITYTPSSGTAGGDVSVKLSGTAVLDSAGTPVGGLLSVAPAFLQPDVDLVFTPVIAEKITQAFTVYLNCTGWGPNGYRAGRRYVEMTDASGNVIDAPASFIVARTGSGKGMDKLTFNGGMSSDGAAYSILSTWAQASRNGSVHSQIDAGGYTGATVSVMAGQWGFSPQGVTFTGSGTWQPMIRSGRYQITWTTSGSDLTLQVQDLVRGNTLAFSPYIDDPDTWGIVPPGTDLFEIITEFGVAFDGVNNTRTPQAERNILLVQTIPTANTEDLNFWLDGQFFNLAGITTMPANGTVMTVTTAYGDWNSAFTEFTQVSDPPFPGDRWKVDVSPMTMNAEDADLSKVMVVPNPYMASSFLDLSPDSRRIEFVNLPDRCTIRIYSLGGHLVNVLNHIGANRHGWGDYRDWDRLDSFGNPRDFTGYDNHGGTEPWNLRNRFGVTVASGLYFFHVTDTRGETFTGKFYVIN